ncbi:MAG: type IV secretory system conjugative DNA transfer family protein, partial [Bacilli bacterium]
LLNFRDPQNGDAWNPLELPYKMYRSGNQDKAIELLDDLALNILYEENNGNADPFWEKTSADYFAGIALGLFEDAKEEEININSINLMTTVGEEKFGGSTYIKEYFEGKDPASAAAVNASGTIMAPNETKASILSVFRQKIKLFASRENLSEMLSHSDIDLKSVGKQKTALFIVIQDEKKTYHSLVTILLKQCYETLIDVAQENGGKLPVRANFLLDEFANMPPLKDVTTMITAARSRRIRFTMIIQNFAQLDKVYGKENAETIKGNCGNIIYLITTELAALEEISKMCGEVKSKKDDKTASTPLVTVSDLQRMSQYETIILRLRKQPFKTKMTPYYKMDFGNNFKKAEYPLRQKKPVAIFDVREFVKNRKRQQLFSMMDQSNEENNDQLPSMRPPNLYQQEQKTPSSNDFNIDDLVRKIDKKIAELDAEEERSLKENRKVEEPLKPSILEDKERQNIAVHKENMKAPIIQDDKEDDRFFDDFFEDE